MTIRFLLAFTALMAVTILMLRVFWLGDGVAGDTVPLLVVGEAAWIGTATMCFVIRYEDRKALPSNAADSFALLILTAVVLLQVALPVRMLGKFAISVAG